MRHLAPLVLALAACSKPAPEPAPQAQPPATPPPPQAAAAPAAVPDDPLRADVDMICGAAKATGGTHFVEIGPYMAEHMRTDLFADIFANIRGGTVTLDDIIARIRSGMAKTGVERCDTLDVLIANDPRTSREH
jgi:hypothetical protein